MAQESTGPLSDSATSKMRTNQNLAVTGPFRTGEIRFYTAGPTPTRQNIFGDFTEATYPGYAPQAGIVPGAVQGDEGQRLDSFGFGIVATVPVGPFEAVKGVILLDADGEYVGAVELVTPINVDQPDEAIAGLMLWDATNGNLRLVQAVP